jgi:hypothetical protein
VAANVLNKTKKNTDLLFSKNLTESTYLFVYIFMWICVYSLMGGGDVDNSHMRKVPLLLRDVLFILIIFLKSIYQILRLNLHIHYISMSYLLPRREVMTKYVNYSCRLPWVPDLYKS